MMMKMWVAKLDVGVDPWVDSWMKWLDVQGYVALQKCECLVRSLLL